MKDRYSFEEADYVFAGMNSVSPEFRIIIARALSKLPKDVVDWTADNAMFVSSSDQYWAFTLFVDEFKHKKGFIFLSECLINTTEEKQLFTIAHEIAHLRLNHKSPILSKLTVDESRKQEKDANSLAAKWI